MYNDNKFFSILALIFAQNQRKNLHFIKKDVCLRLFFRIN